MTSQHLTSTTTSTMLTDTAKHKSKKQYVQTEDESENNTIYMTKHKIQNISKNDDLSDRK